MKGKKERRKSGREEEYGRGKMKGKGRAGNCLDVLVENKTTLVGLCLSLDRQTFIRTFVRSFGVDVCAACFFRLLHTTINLALRKITLYIIWFGISYYGIWLWLWLFVFFFYIILVLDIFLSNFFFVFQVNCSWYQLIFLFVCLLLFWNLPAAVSMQTLLCLQIPWNFLIALPLLVVLFVFFFLIWNSVAIYIYKYLA